MEAVETIPEFGEKRENEERRDGGCAIVFDPVTQKYAVGRDTDDGFIRLFSGGVEEGEDTAQAILREVTEESGLHDFGHVEKVGEAMAHYHNKLKNVNRVAHATCLLIVLESAHVVPTQLEEHEKFTLAWVGADELFENWKAQGRGVDHWVYFLRRAVARAKELGYDTTSELS